jgi:hypothetical protein
LAGHNGGKKQAFHVVAPSLPGYGFSSAPKQPGFGATQMAKTFDSLMVALGYSSYVAQGGQHMPELDIASPVRSFKQEHSHWLQCYMALSRFAEMQHHAQVHLLVVLSFSERAVDWQVGTGAAW